MKLPLGPMLKLFAQSSGAPPAALELIDLVEKQGFGTFAFQFVADDDPAWPVQTGKTDRPTKRLMVGAAGPTSRVTAFILLEGVSDEVISKLESAAGVAIPAAAGD